ncbi:MAG: abortive infection family protein [Flavobacteriales bacterium]|nr:abortive infection family protein [Flavobacteriales bacterium]
MGNGDLIEQLIKALYYKKREDLAYLLRNSSYDIDISNSYGSYRYSKLSELRIFCHPDNYKKLKNINSSDRDLILDSIKLIIPPTEGGIEICNVGFFPDFGFVNTLNIETKNLKKNPYGFIQDLSLKCDSKIREKDYESAVTLARSLIETVFVYIIEVDTNNKYKSDGNIMKMFKDVFSIIDSNSGSQLSKFSKEILSGVVSIINGISAIRNTYGESHGKGPLQIHQKIDESNAILVVNLAKSISEYFISKFQKKNIS